MQNCLVGVAFEVIRWHVKLHTFAKLLMGRVHRKYTCTQTCEVEMCFKTQHLLLQQKWVCGYMQSHSRLIIKY